MFRRECKVWEDKRKEADELQAAAPHIPNVNSGYQNDKVGGVYSYNGATRRRTEGEVTHGGKK